MRVTINIMGVIRQNAHNRKTVKISGTTASKVLRISGRILLLIYTYMYTFTFLYHVKLFIIQTSHIINFKSHKIILCCYKLYSKIYTNRRKYFKWLENK